MAYVWLADLVLVCHLAFVVFAVAGGLLVPSRPRLAWLHLPCAAWAAIVEFAGIICPLTPLENHLRVLGGERGYTGDFVGHYVGSVLYPAGLTREIQVVLGAAVIALNVAAYWRVVVLQIAWRRARDTAPRPAGLRRQS